MFCGASDIWTVGCYLYQRIRSNSNNNYSTAKYCREINRILIEKFCLAVAVITTTIDVLQVNSRNNN